MHHYFFSEYVITINFSGNIVHIGKNALINFETLNYFGFCAMPTQNYFLKIDKLWSPFSNVGRCLEFSNFYHIITSIYLLHIICEFQLCVSKTVFGPVKYVRIWKKSFVKFA